MEDIMAKIINIDQAEFAQTVASGTVLVDFWAPWCSYCNVLGSVLEQTVSALPEDVIIAKINVDNNPELSAEYNITTLPTLILFKDGKACSRHGMLSKAAIIKLFA